MTKYPVWTEGEEVKIPYMRNPYFKMACCDCGMCHLLEFGKKNGVITMKVWRLNRSTAVMRRWMKKKKEGLWEDDE